MGMNTRHRLLLGLALLVALAACSSSAETTTPRTTAPPNSPPSSLAPTTATPAAASVAPGIAGWTTYTSDVYGITFGYPEHWHVEAPATRTWQAGDPFDFGPYTDILISPDGEIAFSVFRIAAEPGADIGSREGLGALICELEASLCQPISDAAEPMCLGQVACLPAVLVPDPVLAYFADTDTRMVTVVSVGREDSFPGAAQYGGSAQLLKSILTTMDVWTPEPGQIPSGS
jgi:hypothetical protein